MTRWEYTVLEIQMPAKTDDIVKQISAIGGYGWELVSSTVPFESVLLCTFKRPRLEGAP